MILLLLFLIENHIYVRGSVVTVQSIKDVSLVSLPSSNIATNQDSSKAHQCMGISKIVDYTRLGSCMMLDQCSDGLVNETEIHHTFPTNHMFKRVSVIKPVPIHIVDSKFRNADVDGNSDNACLDSALYDHGRSFSDDLDEMADNGDYSAIPDHSCGLTKQSHRTVGSNPATDMCDIFNYKKELSEISQFLNVFESKSSPTTPDEKWHAQSFDYTDCALKQFCKEEFCNDFLPESSLEPLVLTTSQKHMNYGRKKDWLGRASHLLYQKHVHLCNVSLSFSIITVSIFKRANILGVSGICHSEKVYSHQPISEWTEIKKNSGPSRSHFISMSFEGQKNKQFVSFKIPEMFENNIQFLRRRIPSYKNIVFEPDASLRILFQVKFIESCANRDQGFNYKRMIFFLEDDNENRHMISLLKNSLTVEHLGEPYVLKYHGPLNKCLQFSVLLQNKGMVRKLKCAEFISANCLRKRKNSSEMCAGPQREPYLNGTLEFEGPLCRTKKLSKWETMNETDHIENGNANSIEHKNFRSDCNDSEQFLKLLGLTHTS